MVDVELQQVLRELAEQQRRVLDHLGESKKPHKDPWDKWQAVTPVLAGILTLIGAVLVAVMGSRFTAEYQAQQIKIQQLQTFERFMPEMLKGVPDAKRRRFAVEAIYRLGNAELAILAATALPPDEATAQAVDNIFSSGPVMEQVAKPPVSVRAPEVAEANRKEGWVYLGDLALADDAREWRTRYLEFDLTTRPEALVSQELATRGALNVRTGMPTPDAQFLPVTEVLKPGSVVRIEEVMPWQSTGFYWARVTYVPK